MRSTGTPAPPISLGIGGKIVTWPGLVFMVALLLTVILLVRKVTATTVPAIVVESFAKVGSGERGWSLNVRQVPTK